MNQLFLHFQTFPFVPMTTNPDEEPNHLSQLMMEGLRHRRHHAAAEASSGAGMISERIFL